MVFFFLKLASNSTLEHQKLSFIYLFLGSVFGSANVRREICQKHLEVEERGTDRSKEQTRQQKIVIGPSELSHSKPKPLWPNRPWTEDDYV